MASLKQELHRFDEIIKRSYQTDKGSSNHHLKPCTVSDESEPYRKITFGERDQNKPHKTILMVGETGTGKTALINVMVNYMLGVQREDKVWFEITDDQSDQSSVHSQTSSITVYEVYLQESQTDLTIIDTPGYGDPRAENYKLTKSLLSLIKSEKWINKLDAVCLVIKATQTRLSDQQIYIYDAVQSLFGRDIADNIVLLFTFSRGEIPNKALMTVKEAKIKCAVNEQNQPVYFLFDNCQSDSADEENEIMAQSWNLSFKGMRGFFSFLDGITSKPMQMTQNVLTKRNELEEIIPKIQLHIQDMQLKQNDLKKQEDYLKQNLEDSKENKVETNTDTVPLVADEIKCCIDDSKIPGSCWFTFFSCCFVKKENQSQTENERNKPNNSSVTKLTEELQKLKKKQTLVTDAFDIVETLKRIALNTDSLNTLLHIDFLIEKLKEINEPQKAETLEEIKKGAGKGKHRALNKFLVVTHLNTPDQTN